MSRNHCKKSIDENAKVQMVKCAYVKPSASVRAFFSPARKFGPWATLTGEGSTSRSDWCWIPCALLAGSQLTLLSGEKTLIRRAVNESLLLGCQYTNEKKNSKFPNDSNRDKWQFTWDQNGKATELKFMHQKRMLVIL